MPFRRVMRLVLRMLVVGMLVVALRDTTPLRYNEDAQNAF